MHQALAPGPVEQLDRLGVGFRGRLAGGGADLLERRAQLASLGAIGGLVGTGLPHALLGGLNTGHNDLD
jgi:hypothetical protein